MRLEEPSRKPASRLKRLAREETEGATTLETTSTLTILPPSPEEPEPPPIDTAPPVAQEPPLRLNTPQSAELEAPAERLLDPPVEALLCLDGPGGQRREVDFTHVVNCIVLICHLISEASSLAFAL